MGALVSAVSLAVRKNGIGAGQDDSAFPGAFGIGLIFSGCPETCGYRSR